MGVAAPFLLPIPPGPERAERRRPPAEGSWVCRGLQAGARGGWACGALSFLPPCRRGAFWPPPPRLLLSLLEAGGLKARGNRRLVSPKPSLRRIAVGIGPPVLNGAVCDAQGPAQPGFAPAAQPGKASREGHRKWLERAFCSACRLSLLSGPEKFESSASRSRPQFRLPSTPRGEKDALVARVPPTPLRQGRSRKRRLAASRINPDFRKPKSREIKPQPDGKRKQASLSSGPFSGSTLSS